MSWEPPSIPRLISNETGLLSSEQRADLSLELPREAALMEQSLCWDSETISHPLPCALSSGPVLPHREGAVRCSAGWDNCQSHRARSSGTVSHPRCAAIWGLPTSCNEQMFALENLSSRKRLEFSPPATSPGPHSSLHIHNGCLIDVLGLETSGRFWAAPGDSWGRFRKSPGNESSLR